MPASTAKNRLHSRFDRYTTLAAILAVSVAAHIDAEPVLLWHRMQSWKNPFVCC